MTGETHAYVLGLDEVDTSHAAAVGGKGANLGELIRLDGVRVPPGFCVTTAAFRAVVGDAAYLADSLDRLSDLDPADREAISELSAEARAIITELPIPDDLASAITRRIAQAGTQVAYAVRSSATAEDLPTASFAGQQDSYLNIVGQDSVLAHVRKCWASLFTDRAVTYRLRNGIDHRSVDMAVVVQQMISPDAAGVLFTADPLSSDRTVSTVEAVVGLGDALVSGLVGADVYRVRHRAVVDRSLVSAEQGSPVLAEAKVLELADLGRQIEGHFGHPQDIEWCLVGEEFSVVQSRPITTVFPIPEAEDDANHVYLSVGHQQMMTDPFRPLGLSFWQLTALRPMSEAGGRLFVDVTQALASPAARHGLLTALEKSDPLFKNAVQTIIDRSDAVPTHQDESPSGPPAGESPTPIATDSAIVERLVSAMEASIASAERDIHTKSGSELFDFIRSDLRELQRMLQDPQSLPVIMAGIDATSWLNENIEAWLGETNAADTLTLSVPNNVTSEMGLALLDVADAIRPHREVVTFLRETDDENFLDRLPLFEGGQEAYDALATYLDTYGMRCIGEIDITRPRWTEEPTALLPALLGNIENFEPGASRRRFEQGEREARRKQQDIVERLGNLPDGDRKAAEAERTIERLRTFIGYREYPKYAMIRRYFLYKQALLREASDLVAGGVLADAEDIFYLRFQELHDVVRTHQVDYGLIRDRKAAYATHQTLTPPRVLTSEGEALTGAYQRDDVPVDALPGVAVSTGTVEGRARVIHDLTEATDLEAGDILVTAYTDPSWSPLFVTVSGLVTEVGGLMSHGAVVAREYGLTTVVGVDRATRLIADGQRIRVNGTSGYVEIVS